MKKIILSVCCLLVTVSFAFSQRAAERKAQITNGLMQEVGLSDFQVQSVLQIVSEFKSKSKEVKSDSTLSEVDKKMKLQDLNKGKKDKLESTFGKETAQKIEDFYTSLKKENKNRRPEEKE